LKDLAKPQYVFSYLLILKTQQEDNHQINQKGY